MSKQPTAITPTVKSEFDAAWLDVFRSRLQQPLLVAPGQNLLPRFAQHYEQLLALPRRARRSLQRQWKRTLGGVALLLALAPGASFAATMNVAAGVAPDVKVDGKCSLIEAIVNANNNAKTQPDCPAGSGTDTINLPANSKQLLTKTFGTVTPPGSSYSYKIGLPQIKTPIVIEGHGSTIERADQAPLNLVFYVTKTGNLTLNDTTVSGQPPTEYLNDNIAGCVRNDGTLLLTKVTLTRSYAEYSGDPMALLNTGKATLRQSTVLSNRGGYASNGIANSGVLTLASSTVSGNGSYFDGAIRNSGTAVIDGSVISGNSASSSDDGVFGGIGNSGTLTINNSVISGNGSAIGAALRNSGTANIVRTTISGNSGDYYFGLSDIIRNDEGSLTLTNSTVSGNEALDGAIVVHDGTVTLTHTTVTGNGGGWLYFGEVGGLSVEGGAVRLEHSVVSGNIAWSYDKQAPVQSEIVVASGSILANNFNLFGHDGKSGVTGFTPGPTDIVPSQPLSGILLPLANNGGANQTHALAINSPALNAAPVDATCKSVDQRGNPRPQGVKCDTGSFEGSAVLCNGLVTTQVGTNLADTLTGTAERDIIAGLAGNDTIRGLNGNDVICAGSGADKVYGGNNNDLLFGDNDNDKLYGDAGNDALSGGADSDVCNGGSNTDTATLCETVTGVP